MSLRLPQSISSTAGFGGSSPLDAEIAAEKAASLGRAGRALQTALDRLSDEWSDTSDERVMDAAEAAYTYMIQRELCGLLDHATAFADYGVPRSVLARMGAARR